MFCILLKIFMFQLIKNLKYVIWYFQTHFFWTSLLRERIKWIKENLRADAKIMVNFRDINDAMIRSRETVMKVVYFLGLLPPNERPFALMFEEPTGNIMPSTLGIWSSSKTLFILSIARYSKTYSKA